MLLAAVNEIAANPGKYAVNPGRKRNEYAAFCEMVDAARSDGPLDYLDESHGGYGISLRAVRFEISPGCFEP